MSWSSPDRTSALKDPAQTRPLTTREKIILLESSRLNNTLFRPWRGPPNSSELQATTAFCDDFQYGFSEEQKECLRGWLHCRDIVAAKLAVSDHSLPANWGSNSNKCDLVQDITTDCSVVASLCAITSRSENGFGNLLFDRIFPWDQDLAVPLIEGHKFVLRMHFNGCDREIIIDDRLPVSTDGRCFYVTDRTCSTRLWPALVEKAYLKIRGGYNFPGSTSCTDIWILTGWVPEQLFLNDDDLDLNAIWQRLSRAFAFGDVLITLGTGKLSAAEEKALGTISEHDYAVLGLVETGGKRSLLIKNPWSQTSPHAAQAGLLHNHFSSGSSKFSMDIEDVFLTFSVAYLNWNPSLFKCREDFHLNWKLDHKIGYKIFLYNPQIVFKSEEGGLCWVLLSKHFKSQPHSRNSRLLHVMEDGLDGAEYICLYIFESAGYRVISSTGYVCKSQYVDSPTALVKLDLSPSTQYTAVISQQSLAPGNYTFSLSCLSLSKISISDIKDYYKYKQELSGEWTPSTAGGDSSGPRYMQNPQYRVTFEEGSDLCVVLSTATEELFLHAKVLWTSGRPLRRKLLERDILCHSGAYVKGTALVKMMNVSAGEYTIIVSTFEQGQTGPFELCVLTTRPCRVDRLPQPIDGRFTQELTDVSFETGCSRLQIPIFSERINQICISVQSNGFGVVVGDGAKTSPIRTSIVYTGGEETQVLMTSDEGGAFLDTGCIAACIEEFDIQPRACIGGCLKLCVERLIVQDIGLREQLTVEIHSELPTQFGSVQADE